MKSAIEDGVTRAGKAAAKNLMLKRKTSPKLTGLDQRKNEKKFTFIRRAVFHHVLPKNPTITLHELIQELEELTDWQVTKAFLLATIVFPESGLVIEGDLLSYTILPQKYLPKIRYRARNLIDKAGGEIEKSTLLEGIIMYFNKKYSISLKKMPISSVLFNSRTKFRSETSGNREIAFYI